MAHPNLEGTMIILTVLIVTHWRLPTNPFRFISSETYTFVNTTLGLVWYSGTDTNQVTRRFFGFNIRSLVGSSRRSVRSRRGRWVVTSKSIRDWRRCPLWNSILVGRFRKDLRSRNPLQFILSYEKRKSTI